MDETPKAAQRLKRGDIGKLETLIALSGAGGASGHPGFAE